MYKFQSKLTILNILTCAIVHDRKTLLTNTMYKISLQYDFDFPLVYSLRSYLYKK